MRRPLAASVTVAALALGDDARASGFDVLGFGPAGVAEVNARAARADDGTATFYSPGGLALGHGVRLEVAPTVGFSALTVQEKTRRLDDPFGIALAFDATIPFEGVLAERVRFGLGTYLLPTTAIHILARPTDRPFFPYYDNRTQRLVVLPALAVKITERLGVGAGVNVLAGVAGPASVAGGASGAPEPRLDIEAKTLASLHAGVRFDPAENVHLAFTYRQKFAVPARVDTSAEVGGVPLAVAIEASQNLFDPDTFVLGTSVDLGRLTLELDASYAVFSSYDGPFVAVHAELPAVNIDSKAPGDVAKDVASLRGAANVRFDVGRHELVLRGGAGFEPSMLKTFRQGRTNLVDGDKILGGIGASFSLRGVVGKALRFGAGASSAFVGSTSQGKRVCRRAPCAEDEVAGPDPTEPGRGITNPGFPKLSAGGAFLSVSLGVGVDL